MNLNIHFKFSSKIFNVWIFSRIRYQDVFDIISVTKNHIYVMNSNSHGTIFIKTSMEASTG